MTTDNRTNDPTDEQVEAAVHAAWAKSREFRGVGGQAEFAPPWEFQQVIRAALVASQEAAPVPSSGVDVEALAEVIRAALVAAQEAAPQAGSDELSEALKAAAQPYAHKFYVGGKPGLYVQIRNLPQIVAAVGHTTVLLSGGVDVGKIESLILGRTATAGARAVAEWLKGKRDE